MLSTVAAVLVAGLLVTLLGDPASAAARKPPYGVSITSAKVVSGTARLETSTVIRISAVLKSPRKQRVPWVLQIGNQRCRGTVMLPKGRKTISVRCATRPTAAQIPTLPLSISVGTPSSKRKDAGIRRLKVAIAEGTNLSKANAARRWTSIASTLGRGTATQSIGGLRAGPTGTVTAASLYAPADAAAQVLSIAESTGWQSDQVSEAVDVLLTMRNPDGGFGLGYAWDAYQDGSVNPQSTSYTVTTAGHVGQIVLQAWRNGAVDDSVIEGIVDSLLATPRLDGGKCLAYSTSRNDAAKPCVYNVNIGAAAFLVNLVKDVEYRATEVRRLIATLRSGLNNGYDRRTGYWVYMRGNKAAQDMSHQLYTAASADVLDPNFKAVARMMARPWWQQPAGLTQSRVMIASGMIALSGACSYAARPGVLAGAARGATAAMPTFTRLGLSRSAQNTARRCFAAPGAQAQSMPAQAEQLVLLAQLGAG